MPEPGRNDSFIEAINYLIAYVAFVNNHVLSLNRLGGNVCCNLKITPRIYLPS